MEDVLLANHASALKRVRQNEKRRLQNKAARTYMRNIIKKVRQMVLRKKRVEAEIALIQAMSVLDRAASRGIIHSNKAARHVSRLARQVRSIITN